MPLIKAIGKGCQNPGGAGDGPTVEITLPTLTDLPANLTPDELRAGLRQRLDKVKAVEVDYIINTETFEGEDKIIPWVHQQFAFSVEKRFKAQSNPCRDGEFLYPHRVWAWDGKVQQTYQAESTSAYLNTEQEGWANFDFYLRHSGIPIGSLEDELSNTTRPRATPWIHRIVNSTDRCRVQPQLDLVDGALCHVVQLGHRHKIWLDPSIDFAIRFRELHSRRHVFSKWRITGRYAYRDFRCLADDVWLPWRLESAQYEPNPASKGGCEQRTRYCTVEARKLAVNADVPDSLFTLQFPPGTLVVDTVRSCRYRVGKGGEETDFFNLE